MKFTDWAIAEEAARGHTVRVLRFDAEPKLPDGWGSDFVQHYAERGIAVRRGAGGNHRSVTLVEQFNGTCERMAEAALERAEDGPGWTVDCRLLQAQVLNWKAKSGEKVSRQEKHGGAPPDFEAMPPYCWGTKLAYVADKEERG